MLTSLKTQTTVKQTKVPDFNSNSFLEYLNHNQQNKEVLCHPIPKINSLNCNNGEAGQSNI